MSEQFNQNNQWNDNQNNEKSTPNYNTQNWQTYQPNNQNQPPVDGYYNAQQPYNQPYTQQTPPAQPPKPKKTKKSGSGAKVGLIVACMVLSLGCGFGGSLLAGAVTSGSSSAEATQDTSTVLYQSVENTTDTSTTTTADVAAAVQDSVVAITTEVVVTDNFFGQYVTSGAGSGVIISEDGYIVTNNHVIDGATNITVTTSDGTEYTATLVGTDESNDIAVVKIDATGLQAATMGNSDELVVGSNVIAIGNPLGTLSGTVTDGIISALDRELTIDDQTYHLLQTDAAINPGNSGGGLFNDKGELIGIVNAKSSSSSSSETSIEGLGFAIPIDTVKPLVNDLIEYGYVTGRVQLGVSLLDISDERTAAQYRVSELGIYIAQVSDGSDAQTAGLQSGDLILSVNGNDVDEISDVSDLVSNSSVGDTLQFVVLRNGQQVNVNVTLTEYRSDTSTTTTSTSVITNS